MYISTRKTTRIIPLLLLGTLSLLPMISRADNGNSQKWYEVEVIVFAQNHPDFSSEVWPAFPGNPDISQAQDLMASGRGYHSQSIQQLSSSHYHLNYIYSKLLKSSRYTPILHIAWRQQGLPPNKAVAVHIYKGSVSTQAATTSAPLQASDGTLTPQPAAVPRHKLDGTIKLILSRYLHLDADLVYRTEMPTQTGNAGSQQQTTAATGQTAAVGTMTDSGTGQKMQAFRLQESRRIHSREIHYMDNPVFGVIAEVIPYK